MKRCALVILLFSTLCAWSVAYTADWDSCADDLDRLRRAARDATDAANEVKSNADDFENCKRYPDMYDFFRDRCQSKAYDYKSAVSTLESELNTVDRRVRSVNSSCGIDISSIRSAPAARSRAPSSENRMCDLYRSYKNKLPMKNLLEACTKSMSEAECKKCLGQ
jgi:hypothetical protein